MKEEAIGKWCFWASLVCGSGQNPVLEEEVKMAVQIPGLDDNGEWWWWPAMVTRGISGKSEQS
jgi:hypothetical protein